jgi:hypothetical protein
MAALALFVLIGGAVWSLQLAYAGGHHYAAGSSLRSDAHGARALYLLLRESGHEVTRATRPRPPAGALLFSLEPLPADRDQELLNWVQEGGTLVLAAREIGSDKARGQDIGERLGLRLVAQAASAAPPGDSPWRDLAAFANETASQHFQPRSGSQVMLGSSAMPVALDLPYGQGHVIALADSTWLENARLDLAQHLELALRLVGPAGRAIAFDEYRHGLREQAGLAYVLARYGLVPASVAALLFLGLLVWRTTPAEAALEVPAEDAGEVRDSLVDARSGLYARSLPVSAAQRLIWRDLQQRLSAFVNAPALLPWTELERRLAVRRPSLAGQLRELRSEFGRFESTRPTGLQAVLPLARRVALFLKELR